MSGQHADIYLSLLDTSLTHGWRHRLVKCVKQYLEKLDPKKVNMVTSFAKSGSHGKSCCRGEPTGSLKTVQYTYPPSFPASPVMQARGWSIGLALDKNSFLLYFIFLPYFLLYLFSLFLSLFFLCCGIKISHLTSQSNSIYIKPS